MTASKTPPTGSKPKRWKKIKKLGVYKNGSFARMILLPKEPGCGGTPKEPGYFGDILGVNPPIIHHHPLIWPPISGSPPKHPNLLENSPYSISGPTSPVGTPIFDTVLPPTGPVESLGHVWVFFLWPLEHTEGSIAHNRYQPYSGCVVKNRILVGDGSNFWTVT